MFDSAPSNPSAVTLLLQSSKVKRWHSIRVKGFLASLRTDIRISFRLVLR